MIFACYVLKYCKIKDKQKYRNHKMFVNEPTIVQKYNNSKQQISFSEDMKCVIVPCAYYVNKKNGLISSKIKQIFSNSALDKYPIELSITKNEIDNSALIKIKIFHALYFGETKYIKINGKEISFDLSKQIGDYFIFNIEKFFNGEKILFKDLNKIEIRAFTSRRDYIAYRIGVDVNLKYNYNNTNSIANVLDKIIKINDIKAINFRITNKSYNFELSKFPSIMEIIKSQTEINFSDLTQYNGWNEIAYSKTQIYSNNENKIPTFHSDEKKLPLFSNLWFENDFSQKDFILYSKLQKNKPNEYVYRYYINEKYKFSKKFSSFIIDNENGDPGFWIPLDFHGNIKGIIKSNLSENCSLKNLSFSKNIHSPIFDRKNGKVKLFVNPIILTEQELEFTFDNWIINE